MVGERQGRGPESEADREARRAAGPGSRGRGSLTPEEVTRINAARVAAGKPEMGADEELTPEDEAALEAPPSTEAGAAPV